MASTTPDPGYRPAPQPHNATGSGGMRGASRGSGGSRGHGGGGSGGGGGGFRGQKVTTCSFCGKTSREVGPMVEGPNDVYICSNCTDLCQNIFRQERRRVSASRPLFNTSPPRARSRSSSISM